VVNPDQPGELDRRCDLLTTLAYGRDRWILVIVHETTGQAPQAVAGFDRPPPQNNSALRFHDHGGRHLRVVPQDEAVVGAGLNLATFD
jgi:hypothetical protein